MLNPNFLWCVENALGIREWLESKGYQYIVTDDKEGLDCGKLAVISFVVMSKLALLQNKIKLMCLFELLNLTSSIICIEVAQGICRFRT